MAIKVKVTADNGVVTEYHRIAMIKLDTNQQTTLLVHSYLSEDGRQIEKDYAAGLYDNIEHGLIKSPYVDAQYLSTDYIENLTISGAYEYLKTLPQFKDAEDI
jgi:hypothetical protein